MRPIYFYITFWGERFRAFFTEGLLRSLLAPGNLPSLDAADGHKFIICCPDDDWRALQTNPAYLAAARYIEFIHIGTGLPPKGVHPVDHMAVGHSTASAYCFAHKAYGSLLHPDMMFADGFGVALQRHVARGTQALLVPALRLGEARLFSHLPIDITRASDAPLVLTPRQVVAAVVESFHDEIIECEFDGPRFSIWPNCVWWRNGGREILVHSFTWSPLLLDYASISVHVLDGLKGPLPDGDYVARNFDPATRIEIVADSDEIAFASWTPEAVGKRERRASILQNLPVIGRLTRLAILRRAYLRYTRDLYPFGDHAKARGFRVALQLHTRDLTPAWQKLEARAMAIIVAAAGDLMTPPVVASNSTHRLLDHILPLLGAYESAEQLLDSAYFVIRRLKAALAGDHEAKSWFLGRLRARLGL